jgi:hypothetical protein
MSTSNKVLSGYADSTVVSALTSFRRYSLSLPYEAVIVLCSESNIKVWIFVMYLFAVTASVCAYFFFK